MKHKSFNHKIFTGFLFVVLMTACSKNTTSPGIINNNSGGLYLETLPKILNLVTDHWQQQGSKPVYVNTFSGVMKNQTGNMQAYLETADKEIIISSGPVGLDNGEIWCQIMGTDLQIMYRDFLQQSSAPGIMKIKVVFS
jgi:hypothetical protein